MSSIGSMLGSKSVMPYGKYTGVVVEDVIHIDGEYVQMLCDRGMVVLTSHAAELLTTKRVDIEREEINESY